MIVNVNLAKGSKRLAAKKTLVKNIASIQNLGSIDILCTDKTGTLTEDKIVLEKYLDATGKTSDKILKYAYLNANFQTGLKGNIDEAVIKRAIENGLEVLKSLKSRRSKLKVLVLTVHNETEYLMKAVDIGVNGYVLKDSESAELKKAIFTVADGETYIQPSLIPALNAKMIETNKDAEKIKSLTKRELDVLKLLAVGMFNKEVGKRLEISERTVKNHVSNIFKKLGVTDRTQAAVFAIRNNLVQSFFRTKKFLVLR